jgi:hypothetical protein
LNQDWKTKGSRKKTGTKPKLDSGHHYGKPPKYGGKGLKIFKMRGMEMKAWLTNAKYGVVFVSGFYGTTDKATIVLDVINMDKKLQSEARE